MESATLSDPVTFDDLVRAYFRYKEWMDYDLERSAYCAKEIIVMQSLFGTAYVRVPSAVASASYEELLTFMENRFATMEARNDVVYGSSDEGELRDLDAQLHRTSFRSDVQEFMTLHEALEIATSSARRSDEGEIIVDDEPFDDCFAPVDDATYERIRAFIVSEHPEIEAKSFPAEKVYTLGLPRQPPDPIDYGDATSH